MTFSSSNPRAIISLAVAPGASSASATASPFKSPKLTPSRSRWTSASPPQREGESPREPSPFPPGALNCCPPQTPPDARVVPVGDPAASNPGPQATIVAGPERDDDRACLAG